MTAEEKVLANGYEDVVLLSGPSYDDALVGITEDGRAVYDYYKMVEWLMEEEGWTMEDAIDWVEYNTIRALGYYGPAAPIVMIALE